MQLTFADNAGPSFISVWGTGTVLDDVDLKKKVWHESLAQWFENGPEDPQVALIRVSADRMQTSSPHPASHATGRMQHGIRCAPDRDRKVCRHTLLQLQATQLPGLRQRAKKSSVTFRRCNRFLPLRPCLAPG